jgi:hypothetical protein
MRGRSYPMRATRKQLSVVNVVFSLLWNLQLVDIERPRMKRTLASDTPVS